LEIKGIFTQKYIKVSYNFAFLQTMINQDDLEDILESIADEKCVLFLGPLVGLSDGELPLDKIVKELEVEQDPTIHYYKDEQLFHFKEKHLKQRFYRKIKRLYKDIEPSAIHQKIAQIPFDVVISITPDLKLKKTYENFGINHTFRFYSLKENPANFAKPSQKQPLIYNLFGSMEDEESLIYTNDELFDFLFAVLGTKKLPIELRNELEEANNFLFLGCDFEMWYMRVILRLFNLHEDNFYAYASDNNEKTRDSTKIFYMQHFRMKFIHQNINEFVTDLHQLCNKEGILRKKSEVIFDPQHHVIKLISENLIDEALENMSSFFQQNGNTDAYYEVVLQANRYRDLQRLARERAITDENMEVSRTRLTKSLLELAKKML